MPMSGTGGNPPLRGPAQPLTPLKSCLFMPAQPAKTSNSASRHTLGNNELLTLHGSQMLSQTMLRLC